jgi:hypothetical protein
VIFICAAIFIGRAVISQNRPWHPISEYEHIQWQRPFQGRILLVPVLRWAASSPIMTKAARLLAQSSRGPEDLALQMIDCFCLIAMGFCTVRFRNRLSPATLYPWLALWLLLWVVVCTYVIRDEQNYYMPYDLVAALFFSIGLLACLEYRPISLVLILFIGAYNRETIIFLVPIWLACNYDKSRVKTAAAVVAGSLLYAVARMQVGRWTASDPGYPFVWTWRVNLSMLLPHHLPQVFSAAGFMWLVMWLRRDLIRDRMLIRIWIGSVPLLLAILAAGWWNETRIFGEFSVLVAVTAASQFEQYLGTRGGLSDGSVAS